MTGLRIYGIARTRAFRALWMANELGLEYEHLPIEIGGEGARAPEFLAINPNGRLPFIVDGGFALFESLAITLYLAKKHSHGKIYPGTLEGEAKAWQWSFWAIAEVDRGVNIWSLHAVRLPPAERDAALREEALQVIATPFKVLDAAVAREPYLLGSDFTVADLNVAGVISRAIDMDLSAVPNLKAWLTRCLDAPGGARRARAQGQSRQRDAGGADAPHRPDQPVVSQKPGPFDLGQSFNEALALHRQGRLRDAEKIYMRVLKAAPDHFDALNLLGAVKAQLGHMGEAHRLLSAAVRINPRAPPAWLNLGEVLHALKRNKEALECFDKARALAPDDVDILNRHANALFSARVGRARRWPSSRRFWRAFRSMSRRGLIAASRMPRLANRTAAVAEFDRGADDRAGSSAGALQPRHRAVSSSARYAEAIARARRGAFGRARSCRCLAQSRPRAGGAQPARRGGRKLWQGVGVAQRRCRRPIHDGVGAADARRLSPRF